ncbi:YgiQ family radical SAM protein [Spirochaeta isovalerica]|uniref:Putative radical SAM protein YgiQ n=1 Tax=Spirochaeta isovalerica TaxID=150 RepID=A0A841RK31_9SPIO|nr:YgiQ family radical SAM protein [Spirochaeta isovalerica]MBB6482642.1 putative radical SAM protein YgiQ [Spirochaeta isovalerica]
MTESFLPVSKEEMNKKGWDRPDFVLVTGDAYVDHPSFGAALIARVLEKEGFRVAILAQPDWRKIESFREFGRPRLAFLVTGGNMDSMVSNYTAARKPRSSDVYSPGGKTGRRPDRATIVYCAAVKQAFKKMPVIIGGMEASLRRLAHYDYWSGKLRRSILLDSKADILVYGMGEHQIVEIARLMDSGVRIGEIQNVRGTVYRTQEKPDPAMVHILPSYKDISRDKRTFAQSFRIQYLNTDPFQGKTLAEPYGEDYVVQNPAAFPLKEEELDGVYELPYCRDVHPFYGKEGEVKALEEVLFSLASSRGCFGGCSFCALNFHQGRIISSRSRESLVREAAGFPEDSRFKGYIHDVGGPTANFRKPACSKQETKGACPEKSCLSPVPCPAIEVDHGEYLELLRDLRKLEGIKKVFIRSGIRYDYLLLDKDESFFHELVKHHISGQLKVAPEHISDKVLTIMGKPGKDVFDRFRKRFGEINEEVGKKQFLVPYLISSHPGSTLDDAVELAEYLRDSGLRADQVQDFIPTPGTLSTAMFYSGYNPLTMKKVHVVDNPREKAMQRALLQYRKPQNRQLVEEALKKCGRTDLIGNGARCLIRKNDPAGMKKKRRQKSR